jgi:Flp pilus assembly pilin Flp
MRESRRRKPSTRPTPAAKFSTVKLAARALRRDVRGANLVEYIILVGVIALIAIAGFKAFGGKVWDKSEKQGESVDHINGASH